MGDIFFVIKVSIITLVLVFLMQIKIGDDTLENQALVALRQSPFSSQLQELGDGGWKELRKNIAEITRKISDSFGRKAEDRLKFLSFGRSDAHLEKEAARKAEALPPAESTEGEESE